MFKQRGLEAWISNDNNLDYALILTGGIPRLVVVLLGYVMFGNYYLDFKDEFPAGINLQYELERVPHKHRS